MYSVVRVNIKYSLSSRKAIKTAGASVKYVAVEAAVLDRFEQMRRLDGVGAGEIGDGAGDFQDTVVGSG